jgi:chemotaxis protein MotB
VRTNQVTQVRGYADQMLRVKSNPTDPSNRRISILVKNDNDPVPTLTAEGVVNGSTPLPGAAAAKPKAAVGEVKPQAATAAATPPAKESAQPVAAPKPVTPAPAAAKPSAGAPAAKPSLMDRLKSMMPGAKK